MKRSGPIRRRQSLRRVSAKRAGQLAQYRAMLPDWRRRHPVCEVCPIIQAAGFAIVCRKVTTHPHHVRGRAGALLCDERFLLACCNGEAHPTWIHHTHKADARRLGLLQ